MFSPKLCLLPGQLYGVSITVSHWQIGSSAFSYKLFFLLFILLMRGYHPGPWGGSLGRILDFALSFSSIPSSSHLTLASESCFYLFLVVRDLCCCTRVFLSLRQTEGLLSSCSAQASLCGDFSCRARALGAQAPVAVVFRLRCSKAYGIFPDQGSNWCSLHSQAGSYPLDPQGSPSLESGLHSPALGFCHPTALALALPASA